MITQNLLKWETSQKSQNIENENLLKTRPKIVKSETRKMQSLKAPSLSSLISERESTSLRGSNDSLIDSLELDDDVNIFWYFFDKNYW